MGKYSYLPLEKSGQSVIDRNLPYRFLPGQPLKSAWFHWHFFYSPPCWGNQERRLFGWRSLRTTFFCFFLVPLCCWSSPCFGLPRLVSFQSFLPAMDVWQHCQQADIQHERPAGVQLVLEKLLLRYRCCRTLLENSISYGG